MADESRARPVTRRASRRFARPEAFREGLIRRRRVHLGPGAGERRLAKALAAEISGEVRFAPGDRALYAADAGNYRQVPLGVVLPRTEADVEATVRLAREHGAAVLPRGGGTSLAGQAVNSAVVIDFSKYMDRILELDTRRNLARVQPGVVLDSLRDLAERYDHTFGPDTSTHAYNTMGGMIGNNSCGVRSVMANAWGYGSRTSDHVHELDVLLYDGTRMRVGPTPGDRLEEVIRAGGRKGEIYRRLRDLRDRYADLIRERFPDIPRRVSGYNLDELLPENGFNVARALAGSEGTCALVLEATLHLDPNLPVRKLVVLGFDDIFTAGDHVPRIHEHDVTGIEAIDGRLVRNMRKKGADEELLDILPSGDGWLFVEVGGRTEEEAGARAQALIARSFGWPSPPDACLVDEPEDAEKAWYVREAALGSTAFIPDEPDYWEGWEDSAVAPDEVGDYFRAVQRLYDRYGYEGALYGHIGEGVLHTRTSFDLVTREGIRKFREFTREAAELVARDFGGSLSGEHGDGQARGDLLPVMFGEELMEAFREFKRIWDPDLRMNPGKLIDARPRDADLRLGAGYDPPEPDTHFSYPDDRGSFARATLRCIGVGKCRRQAGGTMCPSFQVLREEKHTTRGRAHLLFEMLQGDPVEEGWRNEEVKESLDLCLSCKGCKGECPVNVDIATYKAEFLAHYYEGRLRPRAAYAFGLIEWLAPIGSAVPAIANAVTGAPGLRSLARLAAGIDRRRTLPRFAPRTFRSWWRGRRAKTGGPRVVLWPDVFNDHFHPEILRAAAEVLEEAGCQVVVPSRRAPAGRPLYEFGMLRLARRQLERVLDVLESEIRQGTPVIVLEPSVASLFRDELPSLLPDDARAARLAELTRTLADHLLSGMDDYAPPKLERRAVFHGHCHQKAVMDVGPDVRLLGEMGLTVDLPDTGCCGMAGAFGYEAGEKCDISIARAEQALLPAVREIGDGLVIADGFSCRQQVEQCAGRPAMHLAEVLHLATFGPGRAVRRKETSNLVGIAALAGAAAVAVAIPLLARRRR